MGTVEEFRMRRSRRRKIRKGLKKRKRIGIVDKGDGGWG